MLTFTTYRNRTDRIGKLVRMTWIEWCETFSERSVRPDKDGPAVVLAEINGPRKASNVVAVHAFSLDIEKHSAAAVADLLARLEPFDFFAWTTHSHEDADSPRLRVVLPLDKPHASTEHANAWARLQTFVGGMNDPSTKDACRLNYLPSCPERAQFEAWHLRNEGKHLSLSDLAPALHVVPNAPITETEIRAGVRSITDKAHYLKRTDDVRVAIDALVKGESFAEEGARHRVLLDVTWWVANKLSDVSTESVIRLFEKSLASMTTDQTIDDVRNAHVGARRRLVEEIRTRAAEKERVAVEAQAGAEGPYTPEDLARIAATAGCSVEDLTRRWVIQRDATFYFLGADGYYGHPASFMESRPAAAQELARAPIMLNEPTRAGFRRRPITELVEDFGTRTTKVIADLSVQRSSFDAETSTFIEAVAPRRRLVPEFDNTIDRWLMALGGAQYEKLLDWLSVAPDLSRLLSALYLSGHSGGGKTLLAHGLARIWNDGGPTSLADILDKNNEELATCPVVLADEAVPKKWRGNPTTTILRSIIGESSRTLARKYKAPAVLRGALRLVLTANNDFLLQDADDAPGTSDRDAVARRFFYLEVDKEAQRVMEEIESKTNIQRAWLNDGGIAKHVLWLAANRNIRQGGRFAVEGTETAMHRRLATGGSDWNQWVCEWLVRYLMQPNLHDTKKDGRIVRGGGDLLVNGQAISDGWNLYLRTKRDPDTHRIGSALTAVSVDGKKIQKRWRGQHVWYHKIDTDNLVDWASRSTIGDEETIRDAVKVALTEERAHG